MSKDSLVHSVIMGKLGPKGISFPVQSHTTQNETCLQILSSTSHGRNKDNEA